MKFTTTTTTSTTTTTTTTTTKYISKALNPSVSNLHEAQSTVHVYLKLNKQHIQLKPNKEISDVKTNKNRQQSRGWAGEGARSKYSVNN